MEAKSLQGSLSRNTPSPLRAGQLCRQMLFLSTIGTNLRSTHHPFQRHLLFFASAPRNTHLVLFLLHSQAAPTTNSPPPTTKAGFAFLLRRCSFPSQLKQAHALLLTTGLSHKNSLFTQILLSLMDSGDVYYARHLFDEMYKPRVFLWNSVVRGYVKNNHCAEALDVFLRMHQLGVRPDNFTFPFVLKACAELDAVSLGAVVHGLVLKHGLSHDKIIDTELVVMYAKSGDSCSADCVFERMGDGNRDLISWNALIAAYAQSGRADKALSLFGRMDLAGVKPDTVTLVGALSSCAYLGHLELGKKIHIHILEQRLNTNVFVENALLDMYVKCGRMDIATRLFEEMHDRNVISWSIMISGYAMNGDSEKALTLFSRMQDEEVQPNPVTYLAVLAACSHSGLVSQGRNYFSMISNPTLEHYASIVDLLGRSGNLEEAYHFVKNMPVEADAGVWGALLGACLIHRDIELGICIADKLLHLAPQNASYHVLLSNIYAAGRRWDYVEKVRKKMRKQNVKKIAAYSSVEMGGQIYIFHGGDRLHPWSEEIYTKLDDLMRQLRDIGYAPETDIVLHDVEAEEKEVVLGAHSEKIAIAFSLISSDAVSSIRVMKNLRICSDCHTFSKLVSTLVGVEIVMRDKHRFHHFRSGVCSCKDFW